MSEVAGCIRAKLCGGQFDGDTIKLSADGSISPPNALEYLGQNGKCEAVFHRYEMRRIFHFATWPEADVDEIFDYTGCKKILESAPERK